MTLVYPDTSFLLPLYLPDIHSPRAQSQLSGNQSLILTAFQQAEFSNSVWQQVFRRNLSLQQAASVLDRFHEDTDDGVFLFESQPNGWLEASTSVMRTLTPSLGLRTLDALHIAAALALNLTDFWSFDHRQRAAATAAGLATNLVE